jgi:hypothetical protein
MNVSINDTADIRSITKKRDETIVVQQHAVSIKLSIITYK